MSRRYTPGPWEASEGYPSDIWHVDMPSRGYSVVVSRGEEDWDMPVEEVQANARLIAAAPELLDCLIWAVDFAEGSRDIPGSTLDNPVFNGWIDRCRKAIAKAKGGE